MNGASEGARTAHPALALLAVMCSACATVLESMAVSVTLPAISQDFGVSPATATWVMGAPQFVIVALLLPMAALGEVVGYRRVLLGSLTVFALASIVCMLAPTFATVAAARAVQAVGTAGAMSLGFAMLRAAFSDARLGSAIGIAAATVAVASSAGPALAGLILSVASWREVFGLLVLISLVALVLGWLVLPDVPPSSTRFDLVGAALVAAMLTSLLVVIYGIANGWPATVLAAGALAFGACLVLVMRRSRARMFPVFPVDLIAQPVFALSICASICAFSAQTLGFILLPFYLIYGFGMDEIGMAFVLSVWPAVTAILAPVIGRVSHRLPAGPTGAVGLTLLALGFVLIALADEGASPLGTALRLAVCGAGFALFQTPNNRLVMLSAPRDRSAAASGTLSLARQFGRAIGTAIAAFLLAGGPTPSLNALLAAAAIAGLGAVASAGRIRSFGRRAPGA